MLVDVVNEIEWLERSVEWVRGAMNGWRRGDDEDHRQNMSKHRGWNEARQEILKWMKHIETVTKQIK